MQAKKTKKRNPTDATMRNVRALKKLVKEFIDRVKTLEKASKLVRTGK